MFLNSITNFCFTIIRCFFFQCSCCMGNSGHYYLHCTSDSRWQRCTEAGMYPFTAYFNFSKQHKTSLDVSLTISLWEGDLRSLLLMWWCDGRLWNFMDWRRDNRTGYVTIFERRFIFTVYFLLLNVDSIPLVRAKKKGHPLCAFQRPSLMRILASSERQGSNRYYYMRFISSVPNSAKAGRRCIAW